MFLSVSNFLVYTEFPPNEIFDFFKWPGTSYFSKSAALITPTVVYFGSDKSGLLLREYATQF